MSIFLKRLNSFVYCIVILIGKRVFIGPSDRDFSDYK